MGSGSVSNYRKVSVKPEVEVKMIGVLRKSGQPFKAVSRNEYYISKKQCAALIKNKIPYTPVI